MNMQIQNTQANETFALKKLKGIKPKGIKIKSLSSIEKIVCLRDNIIELNKDSPKLITLNCARLRYQEIYQFTSKLLNDFLYTAEDINTYVALASQEFDSTVKSDRIINGLFSGALLQLLTERNEKEGNRTCVYVNGFDTKFDYLFACAQKSDVVIIENLEGEGIGFNLGTNGGYFGILVLNNIRGNFLCTSLADNKGQGNLVIARNTRGNFLGSSLANRAGSIETVIVDNHVGDNPLRYCADNKGHVTTLGVKDSDSIYYPGDSDDCDLDYFIGSNVHNGLFQQKVNSRYVINNPLADEKFELLADQNLFNTFFKSDFDFQDTDNILNLTKSYYIKKEIKNKTKKTK
ncbi:hypothetical protein HOK51_07820 [Candidatus Woesearchaeota archaeon]|jgi:hypothetical protein|nr:hypothetical protein [Candidatus Woesearchaeota archaeon]MBT6519732.1 hypothetical protein [Candidatus Woesearchaeota archaeon]MBT7368112.1 hypothetical protein [Candidatus Woesearchaeota archaeon]